MNKDAILHQIRDQVAAIEQAETPLTDDDRLLRALIREINATLGASLRGPSDLREAVIPGAGPMVAGYIRHLSSHRERSLLLHHLTDSAGVKDRDELVWALFQEYCASPAYFDWTIHGQFDRALAALKSKGLMARLIQLVQDPLQARALPFTVTMLSRWKLPEMRDILLMQLAHPERLRAHLQRQEIADSLAPNLLEQLLAEPLHFPLGAAASRLRYFPDEELLERIRCIREDLLIQQSEDVAQPENKGKRSDVLYEYSGTLHALTLCIRAMEKALR